MRTKAMAILAAAVLAAGAARAAEAAGGGEEAPLQTRSANPAECATRVDVVFVLDTTGSMSSLIEGAKQKIWSIAEAILAGEPAPVVRMGLVAYRDKKDVYVTKVFDLSGDMDEVYKNLRSLKANGGGDGPEHVSRALTEAVTGISWSADDETLRLLFLVGDAPPHTDYKDGFDYEKAVKMAVGKDIFVNTIQCGSMAGTRDFWIKIAADGNGEYAAIQQSGGMRTVETPYDKRIAEVSVALGETGVAYGHTRTGGVYGFRSKGGRMKVVTAFGGSAAPEKVSAEDAELEMETKRDLFKKMAPAEHAGRAEYAKKVAEVTEGALAEADAFSTVPLGGTGVVGAIGVGGGGVAETDAAHGFGEWDLVAAVESGRVKLEEVKEKDLPEEMREMTPEARKAHVETKLAERKKLREELAKLAEDRDAFVKKELEKDAASKPADAFDVKVREMLRTRAAKKGITYKAAE